MPRLHVAVRTVITFGARWGMSWAINHLTVAMYGEGLDREAAKRQWPAWKVYRR